MTAKVDAALAEFSRYKKKRDDSRRGERAGMTRGMMAAIVYNESRRMTLAEQKTFLDQVFNLDDSKDLWSRLVNDARFDEVSAGSNELVGASIKDRRENRLARLIYNKYEQSSNHNGKVHQHIEEKDNLGKVELRIKGKFGIEKSNAYLKGMEMILKDPELKKRLTDKDKNLDYHLERDVGDKVAKDMTDFERHYVMTRLKQAVGRM